MNISYGVGGAVLHSIMSFLSNRIQIVNFAGGQSFQSTITCGVLQVPVSGPVLFALCIANAIRMAQSFGAQVHCYADDKQLYVHYRAGEADVALARLLDCIWATDAWMGSNRLKMNPDKAQVIWLGTRQKPAALFVTPFCLHDGTTVVLSTSVRNFGVLFANDMSMVTQFNL